MAFYTPHNSLLGLALFAGLVGIVGIWGVVPVAANLAARGYRRSADPARRAAALVATGTLVAYSVHCFGDIGLQSLPCNLFLAIALAVAGKVAGWNAAPAQARPQQVAARVGPDAGGAPGATPGPLSPRSREIPVLPRTMPRERPRIRSVAAPRRRAQS